MESLAVFGYSFSLGLSLILAIGAQNAFVLKQGLLGQHVFWVCFVCALSDALLIVAGVYGFKLLNQILPAFAYWARIGGAVFLLIYGVRCFHQAITLKDVLRPEGEQVQSLWPVILVCLAFTWLNPHVYLDTVVLIGSISTGFAGQLPAFIAGAVTASFVFFFTLGFGAALLRPLFANPIAWKVVNAVMGVVMWVMAFGLLYQ